MVLISHEQHTPLNRGCKFIHALGVETQAAMAEVNEMICTCAREHISESTVNFLQLLRNNNASIELSNKFK